MKSWLFNVGITKKKKALPEMLYKKELVYDKISNVDEKKILE